MMNDSIEFLLAGLNGNYVDDLYRRFVDHPASVDSSWAGLFAKLAGQEALAPSPGGQGRPHAPLDETSIRRATLDSVRALMLIRVYRVRGHLLANFDPLGLEGKKYHPELDPKNCGFEESDMDRPIFIDNVLGLETASMREILAVLKDTYCGSIGVEFMHMQDPEEKAWIQLRIEAIRNQTEFTELGKRTILKRLIEAEGFEHFLHRTFVGTKRFGLDGAEAMIPALEQILKRGSNLGVKEVNLGMPHRGRLNVLANVMHKPYAAIFAEFQGASAYPGDVHGSGDVKYHLGTSADRVFDGREVHLSLSANPSHLEAVNPVVLGKTRAKQNQWDDAAREQVLAVLMHGDAAFAGQGMVAECLGLSELKGYRTGGAIHFIVNNQIGFTTSPSYSRSSPYPSDVAKMVQAPIFHVNGDDPEAVVHVARIATEFRQAFKRDVVIDMFCYRRYGHNEADEPSFTQPIMYRAIAQHPTTRAIYANKLINEGIVTTADVENMERSFTDRLDAEFKKSASFTVNKADWLEGRWEGMKTLMGEEEMQEYDTSVATERLMQVGLAISQIPEDFRLHPTLKRLLETKRGKIESRANIDWATAEALAFGTLLTEGFPVRLSGQDCGRGTFSQRHAVLVDQQDERRLIPLNHINDSQALLEVIDSPLSEASVLGFEHGYSLAEPDTLVIWEAQFGDFANGAQVIIDQFIASAESKWLRLSGLVLLLPHGYDGQGPEHSSARPERYLQLCAEDNLQIVNCTTPANYFHVLRRQLRRNFRKPLVVFSPKSLLRHKRVVSDIADFSPGSGFRRVLPEIDPQVAASRVRRVILCSGKIYYDLLEQRQLKQIGDVALIRVEQLYPWPRKSVLDNLALYPDAEIIWCQEEPANMGSWTFVLPRLNNILAELKTRLPLPIYVGRPAAASPATGLHSKHVKEQEHLVESALLGDLQTLPQPFRRIAC